MKNKKGEAILTGRFDKDGEIHTRLARLFSIQHPDLKNKTGEVILTGRFGKDGPILTGSHLTGSMVAGELILTGSQV